MNTTGLTNTSEVTQAAVRIPQVAILVYNIFLTITVALGLPGNFLVLLVYFHTETRTSTDWFIIFITIYDFLSSLLNVPVYLTFTTGLWPRFGNDIICKAHMVISQTVVFSSAFLIGCLALERFHRVCRPTEKQLKDTVTRNICLSVSAAAFIISLPCVVFYDNSLGSCNTAQNKLIRSLLIGYYMIALLTFIAVFAILVFSYCKIGLTIAKSMAKVDRHKQPESGESHKEESNRRKVASPSLAEDIDIDSLSVIKSKRSPRGRLGPFADIEDTESMEDSGYMGENDAKSKTTHMSGPNMPIKSVAGKDVSERRDSVFNHDENHSALKHAVPTTSESSKNISTSFEVSYIVGRSSSAQQDLSTTNAKANQVQADDGELKLAQAKNWRNKKDRNLRITRITFLICLIFAITWLPPWISFIMYIFITPGVAQHPTFRAVNLFLPNTYLINTFTNPILYTVLNRRFRHKLKRLFC
ncbi:MAG: 7 transmembrane receptor [Candidatus Thiodiazotropha sp.]